MNSPHVTMASEFNGSPFTRAALSIGRASVNGLVPLHTALRALPGECLRLSALSPQTVPRRRQGQAAFRGLYLQNDSHHIWSI